MQIMELKFVRDLDNAVANQIKNELRDSFFTTDEDLMFFKSGSVDNIDIHAVCDIINNVPQFITGEQIIRMVAQLTEATGLTFDAFWSEFIESSICYKIGASRNTL